MKIRNYALHAGDMPGTGLVASHATRERQRGGERERKTVEEEGGEYFCNKKSTAKLTMDNRCCRFS